MISQDVPEEERLALFPGWGEGKAYPRLLHGRRKIRRRPTAAAPQSRKETPTPTEEGEDAEAGTARGKWTAAKIAGSQPALDARESTYAGSARAV